MPRNILQDIKPLSSPGRRSPSTAGEPVRVRTVARPAKVEQPKEEEIEYSYNNDEIQDVDDGGHKKPRYRVWLLAALSIVVLVLALAYFMGGAKVVVTPKIQALSLKDSFTAVKNGADKDLPFEVIALSGEESKTYTGTTTRDASDKASGLVVIYNEFSTTPQKLLIETRLETKDGKIYKTDKAVVVPGYTKNGTTIVPGSVEVGAHADVAGAQYNIPASDFNLFGFKGTPKYTKFYARGKTAMTGGASGKLYTLGEEEKKQAHDDLVAALKDKLMTQAVSQIPKGFVYYDDSVFFNPDEALLSLQSPTEEITATAKGSLAIILFDEEKLTTKISEMEISQYDGQPTHILGLSDLIMKIKDKNLIDPTTSKNIGFSLEGEATIVWDVDVQKLATDLAGKSKKAPEFNTILEGYEGVDTAEVTIRPFWKGKFPDSPQDIDVTLKQIN